jgi:hypothetical protein
MDLLMENGECKGVVALNLEDGTIHRWVNDAIWESSKFLSHFLINFLWYHGAMTWWVKVIQTIIKDIFMSFFFRKEN